jgi:cellulose synthase (UDP-forming)
VRVSVQEGERNATFEGVATHLTEHSLKMYLEDAGDLAIGDRMDVALEAERYTARLRGAVTVVAHTRSSAYAVHTVEILSFNDSWDDYLGILYDRVPSLPQRLKMNNGALNQLLRNIAMRVGGSVR